jgi:hypothetical protein
VTPRERKFGWPAGLAAPARMPIWPTATGPREHDAGLAASVQGARRERGPPRGAAPKCARVVPRREASRLHRPLIEAALRGTGSEGDPARCEPARRAVWDEPGRK